MELTGDGNITAGKLQLRREYFQYPRPALVFSPTLSKTIRHHQIPRVVLTLVLWPDSIVLPTPRRPMRSINTKF